MFYRLFLLLCWLGLQVALGCTREAPADERSPQVPVSESASAAKGTEVVKIVFVGQKDACECTRDRIQNTHKALSAVLEQHKDIALESIQLDVEHERADQLDDLQTLMVAPGLYFFDVNEHLVEMQQGEMTSEQIMKVL